MTYYIVIKFVGQHPDIVFKKGIWSNLTLERAKEICNHPEASSKTATGPLAEDYTEKYGPWFFAYYPN